MLKFDATLVEKNQRREYFIISCIFFRNHIQAGYKMKYYFIGMTEFKQFFYRFFKINIKELLSIIFWRIQLYKCDKIRDIFAKKFAAAGNSTQTLDFKSNCTSI